MSSSEQADDRCRALTGDGERCSRSAREDGFCHQHDESDPTVDEATDDGSSDSASESTESEGERSGGAESDEGSSTDDQTMTESAAETDDSTETDDAESETTDSQSQDSGCEESGGGGAGIQEVRDTAQVVSRDLIGAEPDGITGITETDDGWKVTIEVVERSAVPDTQDILGRYEVDLDSNYSPTGYRRLERYRRGDTEREVIE